MKTPLKQLALFSSAALFAISNLNAAETDPVGYVTTTISEGFNPIGISFTKPIVYAGNVVSSTSNSITLGASPQLNLLENSYYIEVTNDVAAQPTFVGERIDISGVSDNTITLDLTAPHNTIADAASFPAGLALVIRPHFTVGDFSSLIESDINSDNSFSASGSDQILLFEGSAFRVHLYYDGNWYENFGSNNVADSKIVPPGGGFFYYRNPTAGTPSDISVIISGSVRTNNFVHNFKQGYQFVSVGYPLDFTPSELGLPENFQASSNFLPDESDLILTWDGAFRTHLLYDDGSTKRWYQNFGSNQDVTENDIFSAANAVIVLVRGEDEKFEIVKPY